MGPKKKLPNSWEQSIIASEEPIVETAVSVTEVIEEKSNLQHKKVTKEQKLIRETIRYAFPSLAIHPDSVPIIISKYPSPRAIFELLYSLDRDHDAPMKKIHGTAGKVGWRRLLLISIRALITEGASTQGELLINLTL